ncbi:major facilitator superfamily domain-containing protein [Phaeosphaeriaceae sp. PMI808]|nr:major facilitator superfamily domain-containing protein [Phaeosphaeriaceae sp. PMI808]
MQDDTSIAARYLQGSRRHLVTLTTIVSLFLVKIEVSVVGTALISIARGLHGVDRMGWVATGYLITYTATLIIWAKLSDIFGRKFTLMACLGIFTLFSGGCAAAQTMNQLVICRLFQGVGAAGMWSIALTMMYELVPREQWPIQGSIFACASSLGSMSGPIIGGGASQYGNWRWIFLFNVPTGALTLLLVLLFVPSSFPRQGDSSYTALGFREKFSRHTLARLDGTGCFFILSATTLTVAVLLEGGVTIAWGSTTAIAMIVVSGLMWTSFAFNEWYVTKRDAQTEPIFPWRFLSNRVWMGVLLSSLLAGVPYSILIITIPQRFQQLGGASPISSGSRLIAFNALIPTFGVVTNVVIKKTGVAFIWMLLFGSFLQLGGLIWFAVLPEDGTVPTNIYGCQVLTGSGVGIILSTTLLMTGVVVETRDIAVSSGALIQFRALGGVLGVSIITAAFNNFLRENLKYIISNTSTPDLLTKIQEVYRLPSSQQLELRKVLSQAYGIQSKILLGFGVLQVLVVAMLYRRGDQVKLINEPSEEI